MLLACWAAKGGSGTTVVATALALLLADRSPGGAVLADLAGDVPAVLGRPEPAGPGLAEWSVAYEVGLPAVHRLVDWGDRAVGVLPRGGGPIDGDRVLAGLAAAASVDAPVVVDCGVVRPADAALVVAGGATLSLLVTRNCYLSLRHATRLPVRPSGVVVVEEQGRPLGPVDVGEALGVPVVATVPVDHAVARATDAGLLGVRLPRSLRRSLHDAA